MSQHHACVDLSPAQLDLYLDQVVHRDIPMYNIGGYVVLSEAVRADAFTRAYARELARHDALRLRFCVVDGKPRQYVGEGDLPALEIKDFSMEVRPTAAARAWLEQAFQRSFQLDGGPLHACALVKVGAAEYWYCSVAHHLIIDGWGFGLWVRRLVASYLAETGRGEPPAPPPVTFVESLSESRRRSRFRRADEPWAADVRPDPLLEPLSGAGHRHGSIRVVRDVAPARVEAWTAFANAYGYDLHHLLLALVYAYFSSLTSRYRWMVGLPTHNRRGNEKLVVGSYVSVVPCVMEAGGGQDIAALMSMAKRVMKEGVRQQNLSILDRFRSASTDGVRPGRLFDVQFNYMRLDYETDSGALRTTTCYLPNRWAQVPFSLNVCDFGSQQPIQLQIDANEAYFDSHEAELIFDRLDFVADQFMEAPATQLASIGLVSTGERMQLAEGWGRGAAVRDAGDIAQRFAAACARAPGATALRWGGEVLSYADLLARAGALATWLYTEVDGGSPLAICMAPSPNAIVAMVAAVMLRRPYVPLDPGYPVARLESILADAAPAVLLADRACPVAACGFAGRVVELDDPATALAIERTAFDVATRCQARAAPPLDRTPAWIIYTSGSTGTPKGVVVPHSAILRLAQAPDFMELNAGTVMLQAASLAFDAATFEIWGTLLNGGTLVLPPQGTMDLDTLSQVIEAYQVNTLWLTAGLFDRWVTRLAQAPRSLRCLLAGGDVVSPAAVHKLLRLKPDVRFVNGYGPTENGVFSACAVIEGEWASGRPLPIGKPVNGSTVYVVNAHGRLLPLGAVGELWVGGEGLACCYLNQEALSAEKFINAAGPDVWGRVYRTGDRVRWRPDGQLDYLGRVDQQVKIRGYRIEIEEIENCLRAQPDVAEAAVVAVGTESGEKYLRACVRPHGAAASGALEPLWRREMGKVLPAYMVPAQFVLLDSIPLNANGKVDRNALCSLEVVPVRPVQADAPATPTEAAVLRLWQGLLTTPPSSVGGNFFEHGGNSLDAMQLAAELKEVVGVAVPVADLLAHPTVREQAMLVDRCLEAHDTTATATATAPAIRPCGPLDTIPMSLVQRQMWLSHQLNGGSPEYNVPGAFRVRGPLDRTALERAFERLVARHQPLGCVVVDDGKQAVLRSVGAAVFRFEYCDLSALPQQARNANVERIAGGERLRSFVPERELPVRVQVVRLAEDEHLLLVTFHHIAVDGWSLDNFRAELAELYREHSGGTAARLPDLLLGYHDYAVHQLGTAGTAASSAAADYWRGHLADAPATHELPLDAARAERASYRGRKLRALLEQEEFAALKRLAAAERVSMYNLLQAAFAVIVGEYSHQRDVLVGTPVSGRHDSRLYPLIGCFINTIVTRTRYAPGQTLRDVVAGNHRLWCEYLKHDLPFAQVLEALALVHSRAIHPVFQLWFVLHEQAPAQLSLDGLEVEAVERPEANTKFDLMVSAAPAANGLEIDWLYAEDLFAEASMARMLDAYLRLLRRLPALMTIPLRELPGALDLVGGVPFTPPKQREDAGRCMADWVFGHAALQPAAVALRHGQHSLSYAQLAGKILRMGALLGESGVGAGDCVALMADRTIGGVVAMAAIQSLGAACLPLDRRLPAERLNFMLDDAGVSLLLGYSDTLQGIAAPQIDLVLLDGVTDEDWLDDHADAAASPPSADAVAYLIYTSGSSGQPKGVRVTRANLVHYVAAMTERYGFEDCRHYAVNSAFHTDLGNTTLYIGLRHGACLHLMDGQLMLDGAAVSRYVREQGIDVMKITPGHFRALCDDEFYPAPVPRRFLIFGGELLRKEVLESIAPACLKRGCRLVNHYGPTETTIGCLTHEIDLRSLPDVAPLGTPLPGLSVRVMAQDGEVPRGAWGELVVGGATVSLGYNKREDLNAKVFSVGPGPDGSPVRAYRTGDRVRVGGAGLIEFGGRFDDQIKIRGFRIELAEIDATLLRQTAVEQAITIVYRDDAGQEALASFVVAQGFDAAAIAGALRAALPDYMVPKALVGLEQIPLLGNGKPDRQALVARVAHAVTTVQEAPRTASEIALHDIMRGLLRKDALPVDQRFFDAGGNSLLVTRLANEVQLRLGARIPVRLLMENHSIRTLAALIDALDVSAVPHGDNQDTVEIEI